MAARTITGCGWLILLRRSISYRVRYGKYVMCLRNIAAGLDTTLLVRTQFFFRVVMASRAIISMTTAPAGTGKTYRRCAHLLLTEILPETNLIHLSNFPVKLDPWGENNEKRGLIAIAKKRGFKLEEAEIRDRIRTIPPEALDSWRDGKSGPWETFESTDLASHWIAIDEIHNYCGASIAKTLAAEWRKWLGEIRHRGARIEFITQHPQKCHKIIREEAALLRQLHSGAERYDPFFGCSMDDWYQFKAKIIGKYQPCIFEVESTQDSRSRWKENRVVRFWYDADLFECFDSFSAPVQGGAGGKLAEDAWQRYGWPRFLAWFFGRNLWNFGWRLSLAGAFAWLGFGGIETVMNEVFSRAGATMKKPGSVAAAPLDDLKAANPGAIVIESPETAQVPMIQPTSVPVANPVDPVAVGNLIQQWKVVGLTSRHVTFGNSQLFRVGDSINEGPYEGTRVSGINVLDRNVDLDTFRVYLGIVPDRLHKWAIEASRDRGAGISGPVQSGDDGKTGRRSRTK
jgi:hypothetical protein